MSISISSLQYSVGISPVVSVDHTPKRITIICCLHGLLPSLLFSLLSHSGAEGGRASGRRRPSRLPRKAMLQWRLGEGGREGRLLAAGRAGQTASLQRGRRRTKKRSYITHPFLRVLQGPSKSSHFRGEFLQHREWHSHRQSDMQVEWG